MAEEDSRAEVFRISIGGRFTSLPLSFPAKIHTGSNPIALNSIQQRQAGAFITRLSNAPTAKRENNAKAPRFCIAAAIQKRITALRLVIKINYVAQGGRKRDGVTRRLRSITLLPHRTILPLRCYTCIIISHILCYAEYYARDWWKDRTTYIFFFFLQRIIFVPPNRSKIQTKLL